MSDRSARIEEAIELMLKIGDRERADELITAICDIVNGENYANTTVALAFVVSEFCRKAPAPDDEALLVFDAIVKRFLDMEQTF